ncbi:MAG: hypothetical protein LBP62_08540 [Clostridiales bacterium]|nr:hypothetical protein [Clostridiales bacterium]
MLVYIIIIKNFSVVNEFHPDFFKNCGRGITDKAVAPPPCPLPRRGIADN